MNPRFQLRLFGGLSLVDVDGKSPPQASQRKRLAFLAALAAAGDQAVSRDRLLAWFWPEDDAQHARNSLNQLVHALRRELGPDAIGGNETDLRLNGDVVASDITTFRSAISRSDLDAAITAYRGPFLDGVFLREMPEFERWIEETRAAFVRDYLGLLDRVYAGAHERREWAACTAAAQRALSVDPLDTRIALRVMESLVEAGSPALAVKQGELHLALVHEQTGGDAPAVTARLAGLRSAHSATAPNTKDVSSSGSSTTELITSSRKSSRKLVRAAASIGLFASAAAVLALTVRRPESGVGSSHAAGSVFGASVPEPLPPEKRFHPTSIVVAPFANLSNDTVLTVLGPLAAHVIASNLSQLDSLIVVAPDEASLDSTGEPLTIRTAKAAIVLAKKSHVSSVVWGAVFRDGDSIRVQAEILNANDGRLEVALDPIRVPISEAVKALDLVGDRLLATIDAARLGPLLGVSGRAPSLAAYREFLGGLRARDEGADALPFFERASRFDSSFTLARCYVILMHANRGNNPNRDARIMHFRSADSVARLLRADKTRMTPAERELADEAIALANSDADAGLVAARRLFERDWSFRHLHNVMYDAKQTNRPQLALAALRAWGGEDRVSAGWNSVIQYQLQSLHMLGRYQEEIDALRRWRKRGFRAGWAIIFEFRALIALGRTSEVRRLTDSAVAGMDDNAGFRIFEDHALEFAAHGQPAEARAYVKEGLALFNKRHLPSKRNSGQMTTFAHLLALDGNPDSARAVIEPLARLDTSYEGARLDDAIFAALAGDTLTANRAVSFLDSAAANPFDHGRTRLMAARVRGALGRKAETVVALRRALGEGVPFDWGFSPSLHIDPAFAGVRDFPPFVSLLIPRP